MKLTILGSGTLFPTKERLPSSFLLETKENKILLDCGHGAIARLVELGYDPREIGGVFISHFHTDHCGDAFSLVHSRFVGDLNQKKEHKKIVFLGPKSLAERFKKWREIFWVEPEEHYPVEFYEGVGRYAFGDISIETFVVHHVPWYQSVGCRLKAEGKTIVYPGDVGSAQDFDNLVSETSGADLLLIESGNEKPTPNHFTIEQIKELAERAKVKKIIFIHIKPVQEYLSRIKNFIEANPGFIIGEDKMIIEL